MPQYKLDARVTYTNDQASLSAATAQAQRSLGAIGPVNLGDTAAASRNVADLKRQAEQLGVALTQVSRSGGNFGSLGNSASTASGQLNTLSRSASQAADASAAAGAAAASSGRSVAQFGEQAGLAGKRFLAFSVAAGGFIAAFQGIRAGIGEALRFESTFNKIAQVARDTQQAIAGVSAEVTKVSQATGVSSTSLANVAEQLTQVGLSAREVKEALAPIAEASLAPSFGGDFSKTAQGAVAAMRQFGLETKNLRDTLGSVNAVSQDFAVEAEDLIEATKRAGGSFRAAGGDFQEFISLFTAVRATTRESAESISTGLRTIFSRIQNPAVVQGLKELQIELRRTREEADSLGDPGSFNKFVGAYEAVKRIGVGLQGIPSNDPRFSQATSLLGGDRQLSRVLPLVQEFGTAEAAKKVAQTGGVSLGVAADKRQETTVAKVDKVREQFLELFRGITDSSGFKAFVDGISAVGTAVKNVVGIIQPLIPLAGVLAGISLARGAVAAIPGAVSRFTGKHEGGPVGFNSGGFVGGIVPGSGDSDSVPASLPVGSFVLRKKAVQALLTPGEGVLGPDAVRHAGVGGLMGLNRYADGGPVGMAAGGKVRYTKASDFEPDRRLLAVLSGTDNALVNYQHFHDIRPVEAGFAGIKTQEEARGALAGLEKDRDLARFAREHPLQGVSGAIQGRDGFTLKVPLAQKPLLDALVTPYEGIFSSSLQAFERREQTLDEGRQLHSQLGVLSSHLGVDFAGGLRDIRVVPQTEELLSEVYGSSRRRDRDPLGFYSHSRNLVSVSVPSARSEGRTRFDDTSSVRRTLLHELVHAADSRYTKAAGHEGFRAGFDSGPGGAFANLFYPFARDVLAAKGNGTSLGYYSKPQELLAHGIDTAYATLRPEYAGSPKTTLAGHEDRDIILSVFEKEALPFLRSQFGEHPRKFARGGYVDALLTPGEMVFSPQQVGKIGLGNLKRMNAGTRYASGGPVRPIAPSDLRGALEEERSRHIEGSTFPILGLLDGLLSSRGDLKRVARNIPAGSTKLAAGTEAMVFRTPTGEVVRLGHYYDRPDQYLPRKFRGRLDIPEVLQPTRSRSVGNYLVEKLPFVPTLKDSGERTSYGHPAYDEIATLRESLKSQGLRPNDLSPENVGRGPDGKLIVIDPGAVQRYAGGGVVGFAGGGEAEPRKKKTLKELRAEAKKIQELADDEQAEERQKANVALLGDTSAGNNYFNKTYRGAIRRFGANPNYRINQNAEDLASEARDISLRAFDASKYQDEEERHRGFASFFKKVTGTVVLNSLKRKTFDTLEGSHVPAGDAAEPPLPESERAFQDLQERLAKARDDEQKRGGKPGVIKSLRAVLTDAGIEPKKSGPAVKKQAEEYFESLREDAVSTERAEVPLRVLPNIPKASSPARPVVDTLPPRPPKKDRRRTLSRFEAASPPPTPPRGPLGNLADAEFRRQLVVPDVSSFGAGGGSGQPPRPPAPPASPPPPDEPDPGRSPEGPYLSLEKYRSVPFRNVRGGVPQDTLSPLSRASEDPTRDFYLTGARRLPYRLGQRQVPFTGRGRGRTSLQNALAIEQGGVSSTSGLTHDIRGVVGRGYADNSTPYDLLPDGARPTAATATTPRAAGAYGFLPETAPRPAPDAYGFAPPDAYPLAGQRSPEVYGFGPGPYGLAPEKKRLRRPYRIAPDRPITPEGRKETAYGPDDTYGLAYQPTEGDTLRAQFKRELDAASLLTGKARLPGQVPQLSESALRDLNPSADFAFVQGRTQPQGLDLPDFIKSRAGLDTSQELSRRGPVVSAQTTAEVTGENLLKQQAALKQELIAAESRYLKALYPGINATEKHRLATEAAERALAGQAKVVQDGQGNLLGTASTVALARQRGIAPAIPTFLEEAGGLLGGAGGFLGRTNERINGFFGKAGANSGQFTTAALLGLPYLSSHVLDPLAGDPTKAVASGGTGGFTGLRALSGGLQGGLLGGVTGNAFFGATGAVVGAGVGAITGFVSALNQAAEDIRAVKIENALRTFSERVQTLASVGTGPLDPSSPGYAASDARSELGRYTEQSDERARVAATGYFTGFNSSVYSDTKARNLRADLGGQLPNLQETLSRSAQRIQRADRSLSAQDVLGRVKDANGGLNTEFISLISRVRGVSKQTVEEEQKKNILGFDRQLKQEDNVTRARGVEREITAFSRLLAAVQGADNSLDSLRQSAHSLSDAFEGTIGAARINSGAESLGQLGVNGGAAEPLGTLASIGGEGGRRLLGLGLAGEDINSRLGGIFIRNAQQQFSGQHADLDFAASVRKQLEDLTGGGGANRQVISQVERGLNEASADKGVSGIFRELEVDPSGFIAKLTEKATGPVKEYGGGVLSRVGANANEFTQGLTTYRQRQGVVGEGGDRAAQAELAALKLETETNARRQGRGLSYLDDISLEQLNRPVQSRLSRLGGDDPRALGAALKDTNEQVEKARQKRQDEFTRKPDSDEFRKAAKALTDLQGRAADLQGALKTLADSATTAAGAQAKLGAIQRDEDSRLSFGINYLSQDHEGRANTERGLLLAQSAYNSGGLESLPISQQNEAVNVLKSLGDAKLVSFDNKAASDVLRNLAQTFGQGKFGLTPDDQKAKGSLEDQILEATKKAADAQKALVDNQKAINETFLTRLGSLQEKFFAELSLQFKRDELKSAEGRALQAAGEVQKGEELKKKRDALSSVGITTDSQLESFRAESPQVNRFLTASDAVRKQRELAGRLDDEVAGAGKAGELVPLGNRHELRKYLDKLDIPKEEGDSIERRASGLITQYTVDAQKTNQTERGSPRLSTADLSGIRERAIRKSIEEEYLLSGEGTSSRKALDEQAAAAKRLGGLPFLDRSKLAEPGVGDSVKEALGSFGSGNTLKAFGENSGKAAERLKELEEEVKKLRDSLAEVNGVTVRATRRYDETQTGFVGPVSPEGLASGGVVYRVSGGGANHPGGPRGTDTVPAWLTPNEFVVNADSARANRGLLEHINDAKGPVYRADGGLTDAISDSLSPAAPSMLGAYRRFKKADWSRPSGFLRWMFGQEKPESPREEPEVAYRAEGGDAGDPALNDQFLRLTGRRPTVTEAQRLSTGEPLESVATPNPYAATDDERSRDLSRVRDDIRGRGFVEDVNREEDIKKSTVRRDDGTRVLDPREATEILRQRKAVDDAAVYSDEGKVRDPLRAKDILRFDEGKGGGGSQQDDFSFEGPRIEPERLRLRERKGAKKEAAEDERKRRDLADFGGENPYARFLADSDPYGETGTLARRNRLGAKGEVDESTINRGILRQNDARERESFQTRQRLSRSVGGPLASFGYSRVDEQSQRSLFLTAAQRREEQFRKLARQDPSYLERQRGLPGPHRFASGGAVPYHLEAGGYADSVPAWLSGGEYVMPRRAVAGIGTQGMEAVRRYAEGGQVGRFAEGGIAAAPAGAGVSSEVLEAFKRLGPELNQFAEASKAFSAPVREFGGAVDTFGRFVTAFDSSVDKLDRAVEKLDGAVSKFPSKVDQTVTVAPIQVDHHGLSGGKEEGVTLDAVKREVRTAIEKTFPEDRVSL